MVVRVDELLLRLRGKLGRFSDDGGEFYRGIDFDALQAAIVSLLELVGHDRRIEQIACAAEQIRGLSDVWHRARSEAIEKCARRHLFVSL